MHTHETIITIEIMKHSPSSFHPFSSLSPPSNPGNHDLLSITAGSIFLGSYKNGILVYILLVFNFVWFLSFNVSVFISIMHVLVAHSFLLLTSVLLQCMDVPQFVFPVTCWWMFGPWIVFDSYKWNHFEHLCTYYAFFPSWVDAVRPQNILPPKYISLSYIKMTILKNCRQH